MDLKKLQEKRKPIKGRSWDGRRMIYFDTMKIGLADSDKVKPYIYFKNDTFNGQVRLTPHKDMEFIGITDPNGKAVYQGDIIRIYEEPIEEGADTRESFHAVVWGGDEYPAWTLEPRIDTVCNVFGHLICNLEADSWEVIGDIYQNFDLMPST